MLCAAVFGSAQSAAPWQYKVHAGDHLVYKYEFEREMQDGDTQTKTHAEYVAHVLVVGEQNGKLSVGFERNRQSAEMVAYKEKGKDKLAQQVPLFQKRMAARPARFAEANEISTSGVPLDAWTVERETSSHLIMAVHELEGLPQKPVSVGDTWKGVNLLGFDFKFAGVEDVNGSPCNRVEGTNADIKAHLNYWWCPATGMVAKLEFEGDYRAFAGMVHEKAVFELKEVRHGESLEQWLSAPDTQRAALEALVLSDWVAVSPQQLSSTLASSDSVTKTLAMALMVRRGMEAKALTAKALTQITELSHSGAEREKQLAGLILEPGKAGDKNSGGACAEAPRKYAPERPGTSARVLRSGPFAGQLYMLRIPEEYRGDRPFRLLISLSGGAGYAIDGVNSSEDTVAKTNYIVLYPQAGNLWWKGEIALRVDAVMREVANEVNIDRERVYIAGFSNGGTGALYYATLWPQRFAAVASLMGAGQCMQEVAAGLASAASLPILFVHGDKDTIVPESCSQATYESLTKMSPRVAPELHILKGKEHEISLDSDDGLTLPFLEKYSRSAMPQRLEMRMPDLTFPRRYWIEILEKSNGTAEVSGQIKANGTIELSTQNVKKLRVYLQPEMFASAGPVRIMVDKREAYRGDVKWCAGGKDPATQVFDPLIGVETEIEIAAGR
jgi:Phospholipase/Carboxylesterase